MYNTKFLVSDFTIKKIYFSIKKKVKENNASENVNT